MIYLALCWTILLVVFSSIGALFTGFLGLGGYRAGDRLVISSWLGMAVVTSMLLFLSNFSGLSPGMALFVVLAPFALLALRDIRTNFAREASAWLGFLDRKTLLAYALVLLPTAYAGTEIVKWYDTGLYHWGLVKWLSEFGSVEGLGLIHERFGLVSSWFTLPAVLNSPPFEARVASVPGGMVLLLLLLHFVVCASRLASRNAGTERRGDLFVCAYTVIIFPYLAVIRMFVSPTPDMPVIVLSCFIAWLMLTAKLNEEDTGGNRLGAVNHRLLPVILSAWAMTIKLSALPLLAISMFFYLLGGGGKARKLLVSGLVVAIMLLPYMFTSLRVSGCLMFPVPVTCIEGLSSLEADSVRRYSDLISSWARWSGPTPEDTSFSNWLRTWIRNDKIMALLLLASAFSLALMMRDRKGRKSAVYWPIMLGAAGTCFAMVKAPTLRFCLGYLAILIALLPTVYHGYVVRRIQRVGGRAERSTLVLAVSVLVLAGVVLSGVVHDRFSHFVRGFSYSVEKGHMAPLSSTLLLPPRILNFSADITHRGTADELHIIKPLQVERKRVIDIDYYMPVDTDQCWDTDMPCAPYRLDNISLKAPGEGLAGGFVKYR